MKTLAVGLAFTLFVSAAAAESPWELSTEISPMTDQATVLLMNFTGQVIEGDTFPLTLAIGCRNDRTDLTVMATGAYFGTFADKFFHYRVDDRPASEVPAKGQDVALFVRPKPIPVIKEMLNGKRLRVEALPVRARFVAEFNISGLEEAIRPVREACHW